MLRRAPRLFLALVTLAALVALAGCGQSVVDDPGDAAPGDAGAPPAADAAIDAPETGSDSGVECARLGGTCVLGRSATCPSGTQPTDDIHAGCGGKPGTDFTRGNFCCVPIPSSSSCAAEPNGHQDCFPTADCHPCFSPVTDPSLTCAPGRTCCSYVCPD